MVSSCCFAIPRSADRGLIEARTPGPYLYRAIEFRDQLIAASLKLAKWEMTRRGIPLALVQAVIDHPEQRQLDESRPDRWIHQSRLRFDDGKIYLL